jgi:hypothetical protein
MLVLAMEFSKSAKKAGPLGPASKEHPKVLPENGTEMSDKAELEVGDRGLRPLEYIWIAE